MGIPDQRTADAHPIWSAQDAAPPTSTVVAFQGVPGAYGERAAQLASEHAQPRGYPTFHEVFAAVTGGQADLGVVPVENSLAGSVHQNVDLLLETDLHVVREIIVRVKHHLLALPGVKLEDVRRVASHPQALAQCDGFLARHHLLPVAAYDTAGAAENLLGSGARDEAVIASRRAGELYGLDVLAQGIEDEDFNYTRFLVLSRTEPPREDVPYKTSLVFAVRHTPGFLVETLSELRGLNMSKIESRPRRDRAWSYLIYVDFEGDARDPAIAKSLVGVLHRASFVKIIGSYPRALEPSE
ncbi:prephenate dehydratase [Deinococcus peraridilitoris]|uniref:prephenate dehydratase n=1 Tax=Deinococcus peraridilitoris (strain DSM 19664 / LMG 22246 / CIP 109416 / KR-200) TaxID=937777 RepID=L0A7A6_DEIPD|nr:prephenate dehydratase [Deinococcus peraridilitoris]AFZ68940.1 prephenate dehydratase [Deinococcus peraridilitoris DSM 19664]